MGLLGKNFTSKIRNMATLAVSRIAILKNHHKARASYAYSDAAQLLRLGYHDRALLRVEHWIREQNILDVFDMIENYCHYLRESAELLEKNRDFHNELKEATSSLIFASSRCGEFPELHKIQEILTSKLGKEFADEAIELHRNNGVNAKMIEKLSTRGPNMEIRMKALRQIAAEIGVTLHFEQEPILTNVNKWQGEVKTKQGSSANDPKHENVTVEEGSYDRNKDRSKEALEEFHSIQNPNSRDSMKTSSRKSKLIPNEKVKGDSNHEDSVEERTNPSIVTTHFPKQNRTQHDHVDWKIMSVRTR
ncbi:uncharacterized protein LOC130976375 [Arachis stenosperma]|uniref:uncharacterized protein LOC130976375 n=1 Tax=Arachis stenosperma TaxID=217475 RepID=UPI0025AC3588|nr:uncharacterized protein LOC130976375 [Arachis stenosperma]